MAPTHPPARSDAGVGGADGRPAAVPARSQSVDVMKGLAIVGVVLHHVDNQRFSPATQQAIISLLRFVGWAVYAFLFAAGYLHAVSRARHQTVTAFAVSRSIRLLVPYALIGVAFALVAQVVQQGSAIGTLTHAATFAEKIGSVCRGAPIYGEQLYFFPMLFVVGVTFHAAWVLTRRPDQPLWIVVPAAAAVVWATVGRSRPLATTGWSVDMVASGLLEYSLGFAVADRRRRGRGVGWVAAGVLLAAAALGLYDGRALLVPIPLLLLLLIDRCRPGRPAFRPVAAMGVASGTIFAYHTPFILQTLLVALWRLRTPDAANVAVSVPVTIVACYGIHMMLSRVRALRWARI